MRRDGPSDKTIVRRARQGDRQAFLTLLRRYDPRLRRLALRLLADPKRIDRVLNRAYMKAWRSLPFLGRGDAVASWLYRTVYNACINEMRWEPGRPPPEPPDDPSVPLPAAPAERRLLALRSLHAAERIPLVLVDGEGFSLDATARIMRRPPEEVATGLARARGRWRSYVTGEPEPPDDVLPLLDEPDDGDLDPIGDELRSESPLVNVAALAGLGTPSAPREPGGHVRLLAVGPEDPPVVAAKPPPLPARIPAGMETDPEPVDQDRSDARRNEPEAARSGAGARRKRRRDAKRSVRTPGRGSQGAGPAGSGNVRRSPGGGDTEAP